jgi:multidrug resistance efflux pump
MNHTDRIPTPWKLRWSRFRYRTLPALGFLTCLVATFWLWGRQGTIAQAVGEIETVRVDVAAGVAGVLAPLPCGQWTLFDLVEANQVVAQLDDQPIQAQLATLREELDRLHKELDATAAKLTVSESDRQRGYTDEATRLRCELEQRRLAVLDHRVQVEAFRLEVERRTMRVECMKPAYEKQILSKLEFTDEQMRRDEVAKQLAEATKTLAEAETQQKDAEARLGQLPALQLAEMTKILAPVLAAAEVQRARIREVKVAIGRLAIRAPIRGTICMIHRWPGQNVGAGDPILTIAAEQGRYIVSYIRQEQQLHLVPGMTVAVQPRQRASHPVATLVERIGPQVELIPPHQCRDPRVQEWGLPVRIALPADFHARPGELIDINFKPRSSRDPSQDAQDAG